VWMPSRDFCDDAKQDDMHCEYRDESWVHCNQPGMKRASKDGVIPAH
jgi:hypothetical protein